MSDCTFNDVTIVCVTYQSRSLVESLARTLQPYPNVVVVDNGSDDDTVAALRALLPGATIIENFSNAGYGRACNAAMREVRTPLALLLNPDCEIQPDALSKLVAAMQRYPSAGIVAPQSLRGDGSLQKSYRPAFYTRMKGHAYRVPDAICGAQWLHGCCMLLRTEVFKRLHGFDARFFLFFEDDDLCLRMQQAGYACLIEPGATVMHTGGASSRLNLRNQFHRCFHYSRSKYLATLKYLGKGRARLYLLKIAVACLPAIVFYGLAMKRRYLVRWLAWGAAALACAFGHPSTLLYGESRRLPGHIMH